MTSKKIAREMNWLDRSQELLRAASTKHGIKASLGDKDNYGAIFTRDAVMAGIAGVFLKDQVIIEGFKQSLINFKKLQGKQGQIPSNFTVKDGRIAHVSFGTLGPKIDSCTWYLVGVGLLIKEGILDKEDFRHSVEQTIDLLEGIEYNGKNLMYIPKGGNWADEYCFEGYILYDQILRAWGLSFLAYSYGVEEWSKKSKAILSCIKEQYQDEENSYLNASLFPGGTFKRFDLAAHTLLAIVFGKKEKFVDQTLDWIVDNFINKKKFPPAFYPAIEEGDKDWDVLSKYHLFDFKNKPHHYHNGGIWWIWLGWLSVAFSLYGKMDALKQLQQLSVEFLNGLDHFDFNEYIAADDLTLNGTKQLCYSATGIIFLTLSQKSFNFSILKLPEMPLIKESLILKKQYFVLSSELVKKMEKKSIFEKDKLVICVCGESGSGKSVTAQCLKIELKKRNISSLILHQDSFFRLPPKDNHNKRKEDISWVGSKEVQLDLMQSHIEEFRSGKEKTILPVVDYEKNMFTLQEVYFKDKSILIVEGVYGFLLQNLDFKIFMERTYQESLEKRKKRSREVYDPFVEQVLNIEQSIVQPLGKFADLVVKKDYSISS